MIEHTTPLAVFAVADAIRDESREAVRRLHQQGIEVIMMTAFETTDTMRQALRRQARLLRSHSPR